MEESTQESATTVGAAPEAATPRIDRELAPLPTQAAARAEQATPAAPRAAPAADDKPPGEVMRIGRGQGTWLAGRILDPQRRLPVVAVTLPPRREEPWMDVARLARLLKDKAELFLVETGAATWELAAALPARLDVYGGAARIWWPGVSSDSDPYGHPLVFAWCAEDGEPATRRV